MNLVVKQNHSFRDAAEAVGVASRSLREWHEKYAPEPEPYGEDASLEKLTAQNKRLRKQPQNAELEREVLKKATEYFANESQ